MNGGEKFKDGSKKLLDSLRNDSVLSNLDTLAELCKSSTGDIERDEEGPIKDEFPNGATPEEKKKFIKAVLIHDLGIFLEVSNGLEKHTDLTVKGREKGKVDITPDITKKLKLVIPKMEKLIAYLKKQNLTSEEIKTITEIQGKISIMKIYAQIA